MSEAVDIFGQGIAHPPRERGGDLALSSGEERILENIEKILATPRGSCPMDPAFGLDLHAYDPVSSGEALAWAIADAIEYGEPRCDEIDVTLQRYDELRGTVEVRVEVLPHNTQTRLTRTYPLYTGT